MRRTYALVQIAKAFVENPNAWIWGYGFEEISKVPQSTSNSILVRLLDMEWLEQRYETLVGTPPLGRPPRRYFKPTELGLREFQKIVDESKNLTRFQYIFGNNDAK